MTSLMCPLPEEKQVNLSLRMPRALPPLGTQPRNTAGGEAVELLSPQNVSSKGRPWQAEAPSLKPRGA